MEIARPLPGLCLVRPGFWAGLCASMAATRCRLIHRKVSWPVNGKYVCWTCLREFPVKW